jgi:hypothetical protein
MKTYTTALLVIVLLLPGCDNLKNENTRPRVIVSTDIGGNDPDDYQSMVHFLVYADRFDIAGLVSSPPFAGRKSHIEEALHAYASDYEKLKKQSDGFPDPKSLFEVTKQGAVESQKDSIPNELSEGAQWIVNQSKASRIKPLYVLVWGSITDVAQAVHHAPEIKKNLRVYSIGSWNTKQDPLARGYLYSHHKDLWWIENNTTFRGMYMGGYQEEDYGNVTFVENHVKDHGALGKLFWEKKKDIKMGDTPSVLYFLHGDIENPESEHWGGSFVQTGHSANYWTDNMVDSLIENGRHGARTVNKFRKDYLNDWSKRMEWLAQ